MAKIRPGPLETQTVDGRSAAGHQLQSARIPCGSKDCYVMVLGELGDEGIHHGVYATSNGGVPEGVYNEYPHSFAHYSVTGTSAVARAGIGATKSRTI